MNFESLEYGISMAVGFRDHRANAKRVRCPETHCFITPKYET